jgi:hypothetical protein
MAKVNLVNKQVQMDLDDIIRFQLISYCYINNITLSELDLDCLTHLGKSGEYELTDFCHDMADKRLEEKLKTWKPEPGMPQPKRPESSPQTIRNVLIKVEKEKLLVKSGKSRKKISLNPDLKIQTNGNILLNFKIIHLDTHEA